MYDVSYDASGTAGAMGVTGLETSAGANNPWPVTGPVGHTGGAIGTTGATGVSGGTAVMMPNPIVQAGSRPQREYHDHSVAPTPCREATFCSTQPEGTDVLGAAAVLVAVPIAGRILFRRVRLPTRSLGHLLGAVTARVTELLRNAKPSHR